MAGWASGESIPQHNGTTPREGTMKLTPVALSTAVLVLSACGGGGDSAPAQNPAPQSQTITGVAATGAALSGATVNVVCSSGSGTATTRADGR